MVRSLRDGLVDLVCQGKLEAYEIEVQKRAEKVSYNKYSGSSGLGYVKKKPLEPQLKEVKDYGYAFNADAKGLTQVLFSQSAEPIICFRELIQNSSDSGASRILLDTLYDSRKELLLATVSDDGKGMDYGEIQTYLTLFDSTKEKDLKKIGEMGAGKVFALTLNPEYMIVDTGNGEVGHKVIFNKDISGKILSTEPYMGTNVSLVLPMKKNDALEFTENMTETVSKWCEYMKTPIYVNGEKINKPFDVKKEYDDEIVTRIRKPGLEAVLKLGNDKAWRGHSYFKGGIRLEESSLGGFSDTEGNIFNMFEMKIEYDRFEVPISRNGVVKNDDFTDLKRTILEEVSLMTEDFISKYKSCLESRRKLRSIDDSGFNEDFFAKLKQDNNTKTRVKKEELKDMGNLLNLDKLGDFLRVVLANRGYYPHVYNTYGSDLENLPLFETIDNEFVSLDDLRSIRRNEEGVYYTSKKLSQTERSVFEEKGVPILKMPDRITRDVILKNFFQQDLDEGYRLDRKVYDYDGIDVLDFREIFYSKPSRGDSDEVLNDQGDSEPAKNPFDLESIKFTYTPFVNLNGEPEENTFLMTREIDIGWRERVEGKQVVINNNHPFTQKIIKLAEKKPMLAKYFMASELVKSPQVFNEPSNKLREQKMIQMGLEAMRDE